MTRRKAGWLIRREWRSSRKIRRSPRREEVTHDARCCSHGFGLIDLLNLGGIAMTSKQIAFLIGSLFCMLSTPTMAQSSSDWVDIKDPAELRALYSNKTLRGKTADGSTFVGHYSADGSGILIQGDRRTPRTWAVKGNNQVCATHAGGTDCYTFQRHRKNRNEIIGRHVTQPWSFQATVEDGVPKF